MSEKLKAKKCRFCLTPLGYLYIPAKNIYSWNCHKCNKFKKMTDEEKIVFPDLKRLQKVAQKLQDQEEAGTEFVVERVKRTEGRINHILLPNINSDLTT